MVRTLNKLMAPLLRRVRLMVGRCVVRLVDDSLPIQRVQITILADETHDGVERLQNFGFTSVPQAGAKGVTLSVGGSRDHQVVVAMDDGRSRPVGMEAGESAMYNSFGVTIKLLKDGTAAVVCKTLLVQAETKVRFETPLIETTGNLAVGGTGVVTGALSSGASIADPTGTLAAARGIYNGHTHADPQGGATAAPTPGM